MTDSTLRYIENVKVQDIPWHRLTTTYKRATDLPKCFEILNDMNDKDAIEMAGEEIAMDIEHQSTLWHATPFACIFLYRIFKKALEDRDKNSVAAYLVPELSELFIYIAEAVNIVENMEHPDPLVNFKDMLSEEYLWSEVYDEEEDEMRWEEEDVFPDDLYYSFYYYSKQVLILLKLLLEQLDDEWSKKLYELI
ncbi:hypothetical protein [Lachnoanaerobaculum gingivalis]|uniref:hypothetical protein n=1 Tax=Lachnoanaerobaculum gingivalis TaxID=2490855 RepID=UPI0024A7468A|nr:hypothetical protein [Lachnoanaerobaculum gingivalis]WHE86900.1 hypothetical protein QJR73_11535 [Lachnoanaerobaculum gingivalis]